MFNFQQEYITDFQFIEDVLEHPWFSSISQNNHDEIHAGIKTKMIENVCLSAVRNDTKPNRQKISNQTILTNHFSYKIDGLEHHIYIDYFDDPRDLWWVSIIDSNNKATILYSPEQFNIRANPTCNLSLQQILCKLYGNNSGFDISSNAVKFYKGMINDGNVFLRELIMFFMKDDFSKQLSIRKDLLEELKLIKYMLRGFGMDAKLQELSKIEITKFLFIKNLSPLKDGHTETLANIEKAKYIIDNKVYTGINGINKNLFYIRSSMFVITPMAVLSLAEIALSVALFILVGNCPPFVAFIAIGSIFSAISVGALARETYKYIHANHEKNKFFKSDPSIENTIKATKAEVLAIADHLICMVKKEEIEPVHFNCL